MADMKIKKVSDHRLMADMIIIMNSLSVWSFRFGEQHAKEIELTIG